MNRQVLTLAPDAPTASSPLPSPPTDCERDGYFERHLGPLTAVSVIGIIGVLASAGRFALTKPSFTPYIAFVALTLVYVIISLRVNAFTPDLSLDEHRARVEGWDPYRYPSVDVLLPIAGESHAILANSWSHVAGLQWPGRLAVYVLDDASDPIAQLMAERSGFDYSTRENRGWFKKAGNLRHGYERSRGEFVVVFDADFCPRRDFLAELMPYFDAPRVGIVQSPQHFRVLREQGWLERGAGAVQEFFYRAIQTSRERRGGAICVGTNTIYRRKALDANGGTTLIEHSEDIHTGFDLRRHGWELRYVPTCVATGICPTELGAFFRQQYRWCMGSMSLLRSAKFWRTPMALHTRLCYLSGFMYYAYTALSGVIAPLIPLVLLVGFPSLVHLTNYAILLPALLYTYVIFPLWHRCRYGLESWTVRMIYGWAHLFAIGDLLRGRPMGWTPTGATAQRDRRVSALRGLVALWGGGTTTVWLAAASWHAATDRLVDFLPMIVLGAFQFAVMFRMFTTTAGKPMTTIDRQPALEPAAARVEPTIAERVAA